MKMVQVKRDKKQYLDLLLLADEQEDMIDRYLDRGDMWVMYEDRECVVGVAVVTDEGGDTCELKNVAIASQFQRKGYGREMLEFLCRFYSRKYSCMSVGTGESMQTVSFYQGCGFKFSHIVPDFFTLNYDHPIVEDGKILTDMLYFEKSLISYR